MQDCSAFLDVAYAVAQMLRKGKFENASKMSFLVAMSKELLKSAT